MAPAPESPAPVPPPRGGSGAGALALALAAAFSSWNALAAPLGLLVGLGAALLAWRRLRGGPARRWLAVAALVLGLAAAGTSAAVLVLAAGAVTGDLQGEEIVKGRTQAEASAVLDEVARRTAPARERARRELDEGAAPAAAREASGATARSAKDLKGLSAGADPVPAKPRSETK